MLKIEEKTIMLTRGDTVRFTAALEGREVPDETRALFTVKRSPWRHEAPVIEMEIPVLMNKVHVFLTNDDTDIETGEYVWDLRILLETAEGLDVFTPMEYAAFRVVEAIGDE